MTEDQDRLIEALRRAVPPVHVEGTSRDLWPAVARQVRARSRRVNRLDWTLAAALIALLAWPGTLPALLYFL
ncbi:MAG: hypothetical protein ACREN3_12795 [Gemmatimonadaceae bacterium]